MALSLLLLGEVASENLPTFAANLLGIFPSRNFVGQNINPQLTIWLRIDILSCYISRREWGKFGIIQAGCHYGNPKKMVPLAHCTLASELRLAQQFHVGCRRIRCGLVPKPSSNTQFSSSGGPRNVLPFPSNFQATSSHVDHRPVSKGCKHNGNPRTGN